MKLRYVAAVVGVGIVLAGCNVKAGDPVPTPTVTVTHESTTDSDASQAALDSVWNRLDATQQINFCDYYNNKPDAAFNDFNDGQDRITRYDFDLFFSAQC